MFRFNIFECISSLVLSSSHQHCKAKLANLTKNHGDYIHKWHHGSWKAPDSMVRWIFCQQSKCWPPKCRAATGVYNNSNLPDSPLPDQTRQDTPNCSLPNKAQTATGLWPAAGSEPGSSLLAITSQQPINQQPANADHILSTTCKNFV